MDEVHKKRSSKLWTSAGVIGLVAIVVAVALPNYADYLPHSRVRDVVLLASALREQLTANCKDQSSRVTQQSVDLAASQPYQSKFVAERKLRIEQDGAVALEFTMNEVRWGAPWRYWSIAIPAGSTVRFDGRCMGAQQFEWRISRLSSVPAKFFPLPLREQLQ